jgi:hypothetical protein
MGFINGLIHTCNVVCEELITPQTRHRNAKRSSIASHKSRRYSDSSTSLSEPLDQSLRSSLDSGSEHATTKSSSKRKTVPLSSLDAQSDHISTSSRKEDGLDSRSEHVTSKASKDGKASRRGLDSQSEHVPTSHRLDSCSEHMPSKLKSKSKKASRSGLDTQSDHVSSSHRRVDGLDTRSDHVPRNRHINPRWLSKHGVVRADEDFDSRSENASEHMPSKLRSKSKKASRSGLDSQSDHVSSSHRRVDGLDTRSDHVPRNRHINPRWLSKYGRAMATMTTENELIQWRKSIVDMDIKHFIGYRVEHAVTQCNLNLIGYILLLLPSIHDRLFGPRCLYLLPIRSMKT